jgi:hypothetical protein
MYGLHFAAAPELPEVRPVTHTGIEEAVHCLYLGCAFLGASLHIESAHIIYGWISLILMAVTLTAHFIVHEE